MSSTWKNKNISDIIKYWNNSHSNLTKASAGFTRLEAVPKNDVTYSWCIRCPSHYWAVLKNRYFRPCQVPNTSSNSLTEQDSPKSSHSDRTEEPPRSLSHFFNNHTRKPSLDTNILKRLDGKSSHSSSITLGVLAISGLVLPALPETNRASSGGTPWRSNSLTHKEVSASHISSTDLDWCHHRRNQC